MQPALRKKLFDKALIKRIPINGTFELTPRCNMNCKMCYIRMSAEEMKHIGREYTANEWINMGRMCMENGMLFLLLTGGEPFLRKDFREIYTELSKMGLVISINSNGTLITQDTLNWLKLTPPSKINITLYGGSNETYNKLCGNPNGFTQVSHAIDMLLEARINVGLNASFTPLNVRDIEAIYDFAAKRKLTVRTATYMYPPVRGVKKGCIDNTSRFTPKEAGKALFESKKYQYPKDVFDAIAYKVSQGIALEKDCSECTGVPDEHMGCIAGRCSFCITWNGKMVPCGMMCYPMEEPFKNGFLNSWNTICEETDKIYLPKECTECDKRHACTVCGAITIAEGNGDSTKKPKYMCNITNEYVRLCSEYINEGEHLKNEK